MPKRRVQVTLSEYDYQAVRRAAEREGTSLASVVREAVQEYRVDPGHKKRQLAALDAVEALPESALSPVPDLDEWKREYTELKCSIEREEALRILVDDPEPAGEAAGDAAGEAAGDAE